MFFVALTPDANDLLFSTKEIISESKLNDPMAREIDPS